jgi:hypothetical protein
VNILVSAVSRVFDFYTFEDYYYKSPPPFQESTANMRRELARISKTKYSVRGPTFPPFFECLISAISQIMNSTSTSIA